ncbi:28679_t:CDS:1, partial [Gigaspora margarita]
NVADISIVYAEKIQLVLRLQPGQGIQEIGKSGYNWNCEVSIL